MTALLPVPIFDGGECLNPNPARTARGWIVVLPAWVKTDRYPLVVFGAALPVDVFRIRSPAVRAITGSIPLGYNAGLAHVSTNGLNIDLVDVLTRLDGMAGRDARAFAHHDIGRLHANRRHRDM